MKSLLSIAVMALVLSLAAHAEEKKNPVVLIETSMGNIEVELYPDKAPETVKNFLSYVNDKFYDGTIFHRVIPNFMIQGGGTKKDLQFKATKPPIKNEAANGLKNDLGTVAMARMPDPDSAAAEFFINVAKNDFLDHRNKTPQGFGYCVFGKVISGMDVVNKIKDVKTHSAPGKISGEKAILDDVPMDPVEIKTVREKK